MFSTKASKLIIPGFVPGFTSAYFLNPADVEQLDNGGLRVGGTDSQPATFDPTRPINFVNFVERDKDLNEFGLKEKKGYYGYLKNLYVNFDLFKEKIEQSNKTIKDILLDILNENSFWNFQIVEGELKKTNEQAKDELRAIAPGVAAPAENAGVGVFNPLGGGYTPGRGFTNNKGFGAVGGGGAIGGGFGTTVGQFGGGYTPGAGLSGATGFGAATAASVGSAASAALANRIAASGNKSSTTSKIL